MIAKLGDDELPLGGDIVLSLEGIKVDTANLAKIRQQLGSKPSGTPFKVTVLRAGRLLELTGRVP